MCELRKGFQTIKDETLAQLTNLASSLPRLVELIGVLVHWTAHFRVGPIGEHLGEQFK